MKRYIRSNSETPFSTAQKIKNAQHELDKYPREWVELVDECQERIAQEISKHYTDEEDIDYPTGPKLSDIKRDYMLCAIEDYDMTEEVFEDIFALIDVINAEYAMRYA